LQSSITGIATYYAGGGGGGSNVNVGATGVLPTGGSGGGGNGSTDPSGAAQTGTAGTANTGGGGGGSDPDLGSANTNGGSGVVIIAYPDTFANLVSIGATLTTQSWNGSAWVDNASGSTTPNTTIRSGYKVYRFSAGTGTITW
jgi:hypothetical protein